MTEYQKIVWDGCDSYITIEEAIDNPDLEYSESEHILYHNGVNEAFEVVEVTVVDMEDLPEHHYIVNDIDGVKLYKAV